MKKTILFLSILFSLLSASVFALPGFSPLVRDIPGEYVFYRDLSFENESYVGFLTYDEKTYSARYYSPAKPKQNLPEKDIQIFFTINPDSDHLELTGEKVLGIQFLGEDGLQIVNYLHDLVYEFNSRRIKFAENSNVASRASATESERMVVEALETTEGEQNSAVEPVETTTTTTAEDFAQFGGSVQIEWNAIIPLFNLESIYSENDAKKMFYVVTIGRINSTEDKSFENFKGFPSDFKEKKHKAKISRKTGIEKVELNGFVFSVYSDWERHAENMFTLGDFAVLFETPAFENPTSENKVPEKNLDFIKRRFLLSSGQNYIDFANLKFADNSFNADYYNFETGNVTKSFKKFLKNENSESYEYFSLSVFRDVYEKNKKYFDKIVESFEVKN